MKFGIKKCKTSTFNFSRKVCFETHEKFIRYTKYLMNNPRI